MIDTVLEPCPFCGNKNPRLIESAMDDPSWALASIKCDKCGATGARAHRTTESAVAWWNGSRATITKKLEAMEAESEDIDNQINLRCKCEASLRRIISMAGAPDAADACRNIIKDATECLA